MNVPDLQDAYSEAKYMSFMCLHAEDKTNWRKWCRIAAEINITIHIKQQEQQ
jgi:hypothetical protein